MATIAVSSVQGLEAALAAAKAGDTISLSGGNYGELTVRGKVFDTPVKIVAADAANPPVFDSIYIYKSEGLTFTNVSVEFKPDQDTLSFSSAVKINLSKDISFVGGEFKGGPAVNGVPQDAETGDSTGNVLGMPAGRAVTIESSQGVTIQGVEIHEFHKGLVLAKSSGLVIKDNEIYDLRTSPITGGGVNDVVIDGNHLHDSNPWRWGEVDHADFIHLWTSETVGQSKNITITNNVLEQGDGEAILGIYLDDNANKLGFTNVDISNNLIMNGDHQGIGLENVANGRVVDNTLLRSSGTSKDAPGILLTKGSHDVLISGNITKFIGTREDNYNLDIRDNILVQADSIYEPGYYSLDDVESVADLSVGAAHDFIETLVSAWKPVDIATKSVTAQAYETRDTDVAGKFSTSNSIGDLVVGGRGDDSLIGGYGHDTLVGGAGADLLSGSRGHDVLQGDAGADTFNFAKDYPTNGGFDIIVDFDRTEGDIINLHSIDANTATTGDDAFAFIGQDAFHKVAGELRVKVSDGNSIIEGDVDGDGVADFSIKVMGVTDLSSNDFKGVATGSTATTAAKSGTTSSVTTETATALPQQLDTTAGMKLSASGSKGSVLVGGRGGDTLTGLHANDTLIGGDGKDYLSGSRGDDLLVGGAGADTFNFAADYASVGGTDVVQDFSHADGDILRLSSMDANTTTTANEAFTFIGTSSFRGAAGEVRYAVVDGNAIVQGDVNGDGVADFSIKLIGVGTLVAGDFAL
ncbi:right-handed parallel beta-helix repeat-containing protein [Phenylobacterium kunshanense]|nr:right-handed parallel beta-helix repeat-containing protein [Phenylobacterium kunshanense]